MGIHVVEPVADADSDGWRRTNAGVRRGEKMSKEAAAAILVQTLFTTDTSMEHLMMSHAKAGNADPKEIAKFIVPYYKAMLQEMDGGGSESGDSKSEAKP
jgi:hypothetical protein